MNRITSGLARPADPNDPDDWVTCPDCEGAGFIDKWCAVDGRFDGGEVFRLPCDTCADTGKVLGE